MVESRWGLSGVFILLKVLIGIFVGKVGWNVFEGK